MFLLYLRLLLPLSKIPFWRFTLSSSSSHIFFNRLQRIRNQFAPDFPLSFGPPFSAFLGNSIKLFARLVNMITVNAGRQFSLRWRLHLETRILSGAAQLLLMISPCSVNIFIDIY